MALIEFTGISKHFPGVQALDRVSFSVEAGSCHALMGENGAGKSTLGKILAGVYQADDGQILLNGQRVAPASPLAARSIGIAMVHQELAFCPNLSIAENLCLGDMPRRFGWIDRRRMRDSARTMLREIGADFDVDQPIGQLTTGQEQLVQIAAAVGIGERLHCLGDGAALRHRPLVRSRLQRAGFAAIEDAGTGAESADDRGRGGGELSVDRLFKKEL